MHSTLNWAWAAGLFEGEGSLNFYKCSDRQFARLYIKMTDLDVLEKLRQVWGYGNIVANNAPSIPSHYKQQYVIQISKRTEVTRIIEKMLPFFGNRRAYAALNILDYYELDNPINKGN